MLSTTAPHPGVAIVGGGAIGEPLLDHLISHAVCPALVADGDELLARPARRRGARCVTGDALDPRVLRQAGDGCDVLLVLTDGSDERRLGIALVARRLAAVAHVMVCLSGETHERTCREFGLQAIDPWAIAAAGIVRRLWPHAEGQR